MEATRRLIHLRISESQMVLTKCRDDFHFPNAVLCPVGTYFALEHHECESCWLGSYQDQEGQLECKSCPEGTSTAYLHSRSIGECKGRKARSGPPLSLHASVVLRLLRRDCLQVSASPAATLSTAWRSASRVRWVTSSPDSEPGSVWSVLTRRRRSPEEQWTRRSAEVIHRDTLSELPL